MTVKYVIHKIKSQYPELYTVVCGQKNEYRANRTWRGVTCKKCLKLKGAK